MTTFSIDDPTDGTQAPKHAMPRPVRAPRRGLRTAGRVLLSLVAVAVVVATGVGWSTFRNLTSGITTSQALAGGPASSGGDQNILVMGLDSRLDQHGRPLPKEMYDALHAGDETVGGYNANVLIVLHIPGEGGPITAISIPRDDYVSLAGCSYSPCKGKIKQAYGRAYQHALDVAAEKPESSEADPTVAEQRGREAGRKAEIDTVRKFLGIPIDHFVEVTLAAFFQIAQVVQPITVCLNADTADPFSGADFRAGEQQLDASQAMAFVRQRRDVNDEMFTDMDRTRRQQAFIASLVSALRHGGTLSSPSGLRHLLDVARQNVAVDSGFDLNALVSQASAFTNRPVSLYTLPIAEFGQDPDGEDVNRVDVPTIRAIVHNLVTTNESDKTSSAPAPKLAVPAVLNVVNATQHAGLATAVLDAYSSRGFSPGEAGTADEIASASTVVYGKGAEDAAASIATEYGLTARPSTTLSANTVQFTVGSDFPAEDYATESQTKAASPLGDSTTSASPVTTVAATATGSAAPVPTDLSRMNVSDQTCVK